MKFSGCMRQGWSGGVHYSVQLDGIHFPLCYGTLCGKVGLPKITRKTIYNASDYMFSWGYDGTNPQLLAATMLAVAMGIDFDPVLFSATGDQVPIASVSHLIGRSDKGLTLFGKQYLDTKPQPYCANIPLAVKKLFKAFTSEVIAELPDTWELTTDEILQWIKTKPKTKGQ